MLHICKQRVNLALCNLYSWKWIQVQVGKKLIPMLNHIGDSVAVTLQLFLQQREIHLCALGIRD